MIWDVTPRRLGREPRACQRVNYVDPAGGKAADQFGTCPANYGFCFPAAVGVHRVRCVSVWCPGVRVPFCALVCVCLRV